MAPLAPIIGTCEAGLAAAWTSAAAIPLARYKKR